MTEAGSNLSGTMMGVPAIRPVARFVGIGLLLMALFTLSWALWSLAGLPIAVAVAAVAAFGALAAVYVIRGIGLVRASGSFPDAASNDGTHRGRTLQIGYAVTFGTEGVVIGAVSGLLIADDAGAYLQPAIALIVGLHFIPFGFIFRRTVDFFVAGWVVVCAALGIWVTSSSSGSGALTGALVSLATAGGTAAYGCYLLRLRKLITAEASPCGQSSWRVGVAPSLPYLRS